MILRIILAVLLALPLIGQASDYRVIHSDWIPEANYVQAIDPILSPSNQLLGLACLKSDRLEILLFDRDTIVHISNLNNLGYPVSMTNLIQGDTLVIYIDYDVGYYGDSTYFQKVSLIGDDVCHDTARYAIPTMWNYRDREAHRQKVRIEKANQGSEVRLCIEKHMTYYDFSSGGAEWWREDLSTTMFIDPVSLALLERFSYPFMERGRFNSSPDRQFAAYGMHYYDYQDPTSSGYYRFSSMQLLDSSGHADFQENFAYGDQWLAVGDVSDQYPFDEVIYYGLNAGLDGAHAPAQWNLSCYNFSTGSPVEVWYRPISGIQLDYLLERASVLMAWRGDSTLLFINAADGDIFDSTVVPGHSSVKQAFAYWNDSPLHAAVMVGDSAMILEFDAIVDVPSSEPLTPSSFTLSQNYPNPFNATTEIRFSLAQSADVSLTIYNLLGQEVKTLIDGKFSAGEHRVTWDGTDSIGHPCATGVYLYRLESEETSLSRKMILLK